MVFFFFMILRFGLLHCMDRICCILVVSLSLSPLPPPSVVELMIRHRADAPCPSGHLLWLPIRLLKWETQPPCVKSSENNAVITIPAWPATVTHPYVLPYQAQRAPTALDAARPRTSAANEQFQRAACKFTEEREQKIEMQWNKYMELL